MGNFRVGVLAAGLAVLIVELALGIPAWGMMLSLAGVGLLYWLARLGPPRPRL
jgi:hypothetical protein